MSEISHTKIILSGGLWLRDFSVYLQYNGGPKKHVDYLYELQTDDIMARMEARKAVDKCWNVFTSAANVRSNAERKRKLKWTNLTFNECAQHIRDDILKHRPQYQVLHAPDWWERIPKPDVPLVEFSQPRVPSTNGQYTKLAEAYEDPNYGAQEYPEGVRVQAHFFSNSVMMGTVRFFADMRDDNGNYVECTDAIISSTPFGLKVKELIHEFHGTIFDGFIVHEKAQDIVAAGHQGLGIQRDNGGPAKFWVTDCLAVKGTSILEKPLEVRMRYVDAIIQKWVDAHMDPLRAALLAYARVTVEDKGRFRALRLQQGESIHLRDIKGVYHPGSPTDAWITEVPMERFYAVIGGYEEPKSGKAAVAGHIRSIVLHNKGGKVMGKTSVMESPVRQYISENRERVIGTVVEVHAEGRREDGTLIHPRFIAFRENLKPEVCK